MKKATLCIAGVTAENRGKCGHQVDRFDWPIDYEILADVGAKRHEPRCAGKRVTRAMVLEAIATWIGVAVAAKIGKDKEICAALVFGLVLDGGPQRAPEAMWGGGGNSWRWKGRRRV